MANDILSQVLGSALDGAGRGSNGSPLGGLLGDLLGGARSRTGEAAAGGMADRGLGTPGGLGGLGGLLGGGASAGGSRQTLMLMLLPIALQWVQRNGGVGALLQRFQQAGQGPKVQSWVSTGENEPVDPALMREVVGHEELSRLSRQLDTDEEEVAGGLAQIFPEVVNQLTPAGELPPDADERLASGSGWLQQWLQPKADPR